MPYVPGWQLAGSSSVDPTGQKLPKRQVRHTNAPVSFWKLPLGHASHWPIRFELAKKPALHLVALFEPSGQKCPNGQSLHSSGLLKSLRSENVPF